MRVSLILLKSILYVRSDDVLSGTNLFNSDTVLSKSDTFSKMSLKYWSPFKSPGDSSLILNKGASVSSVHDVAISFGTLLTLT